jgi:hypothetical protein
MGYNHYWEREIEIDEVSFGKIVTDFQRMVLALDDLGVRLAGPLGEGLPEISLGGIAFNGLANCGHVKNEEICIPFAAPNASGIGNSINAVTGSWFIGVLLKHRTCNGDCSYETMTFKRVAERKSGEEGRCFDSCKTGFRPYDLAVQCLLLISKHHLDDRIEVWSGGSDFHWNDPRRLCYAYLGYPLHEFHLDRDDGLIRNSLTGHP